MLTVLYKPTTAEGRYRLPSSSLPRRAKTSLIIAPILDILADAANGIRRLYVPKVKFLFARLG